MKLLQSSLGRLRIIAFLEGISFILLVGIGMPLKYVWGYTYATQEIGMGHGLLFVVYVLFVIPVTMEYNWSWSRTALVLLASILPLGTFVAEYKVFRHAKVEA